MVDRFRRNKAAFWTAAVILAAIAAMPSAILVREAKRYNDFIKGVTPGTVPQTHPTGTPRNDKPAGAEGRLHFVSFHLRSPKAKEVEVIGDFNRWRKGTLPLQKSGGEWEVLLPLPAGRYKYQYIVDGQPQGEPAVKVVP